jgi:hypothetical protein
MINIYTKEYFHSTTTLFNVSIINEKITGIVFKLPLVGITFKNVKFINCTFNLALIKGCTFDKCTFINCKSKGPILLTGNKLTTCKLQGLHIGSVENCNFTACNFSDCTFNIENIVNEAYKSYDANLITWRTLPLLEQTNTIDGATLLPTYSTLQLRDGVAYIHDRHVYRPNGSKKKLISFESFTSDGTDESSYIRFCVKEYSLYKDFSDYNDSKDWHAQVRHFLRGGVDE